VEAKKLRAGELGNEEGVAMADWIDIGVFGRRSPGQSGDNPLYLEKHLITDPKSVISLVVDEPPEKAGIDPYNKLIDRRPKDNTLRTG
jgi:hypothetical protein